MNSVSLQGAMQGAGLKEGNNSNIPEVLLQFANLR